MPSRRLIKNTLENPYNQDQFKEFIRQLLTGADFDKAAPIAIPDAYKDFIKSARRIAKYKFETDDYLENIINVIVVKLRRTSSIDRARTAQRNFVARYLNSSRGYLADAALVAFISEDEDENISDEWRFSLIKMDYVSEIITDENGNPIKRKTSKELTPAKRFSFLVGANEDSHTAQKQLIKCLLKSANKEQITVDDLLEAFSIEKVSKEFFDKYKNLFADIKEELERLYRDDADIRADFKTHNINIVDFAKKTLGQLVFLYFIQKKGWMGVKKDCSWGSGDKKFLRKLFNKEHGNYKNFFNNVLEPLFYGALAEDRRVNNDLFTFDEIEGNPTFKIPFLNGGLFEPINEYAWKDTNITIKDDIFKKVFETFDLYNFTVKEDEPLEKEIAIDPEMLGKVFEKLLDIKYTVYTPREIVHYMCQESLINYLYTKLNTKKISITEEEKQEQLKLIKNNKSQQLSLTKEIFEENISKEDIAEFIHNAGSTYENKTHKEIKIELPQSIKDNAKNINEALKNIKVCDPAIGSGAFPVGMMNEIVRARLELNNFIKDETKTAYIFKREAVENSIYGVDLDSGAVEIAKLRFWLSLVVDEDNSSDIQPLPNLDYKIMQGNSLISSYEGIDFDEIVDQQQEVNQLGLFAMESDNIINQLRAAQNRFIKESDRIEKAKIKEQIEDIIINLVKSKLKEKCNPNIEEHVRNFAQNREFRNFFPWKLYFGDAFEYGGFDVVIANPPYWDSEHMTKEAPLEREIYRQNYSSTMGNWDLFIPFIEKAFDLGHANSTISYIVPNKLLGANYSKTLREIMSTKSLIEIRDYSRLNVFREKDVYPIVFTLKNNNFKQESVNMTTMLSEVLITSSNSIPASLFYRDILWDKYFQKENIVSLLSKMSEYKELQSITPLITGAATVGEAYEIKNDLYSDEFNLNLNKKLINSGTIDKYSSLWGIKSTQYIKGKYDKPVINNNCLKKINANRLQQANSPKIIIANMTKTIEAFLDLKGEYLAAKSTTIIVEEVDLLKYICALLNSKLITLWYQINFNALKMAGEAINFGPKELAIIPVPNLDKQEQQPFIDIVEKILEIKENDPAVDTSKLENQIDEMVYKLYGLTDEEILLVEPDRLTGVKFDIDKPKAAHIVEKIASSKPDLMDNDREFCKLFDEIALNNGYTKETLPQYWSIGRAIYNYKKEHNLSAAENAQTTSQLTTDVDLSNPLLKEFKFDKKPTIREIIKHIADYDIDLLDNDRKLIELFDGIALTNGYEKTNLPKYWTIIRASFDYKKEAVSA